MQGVSDYLALHGSQMNFGAAVRFHWESAVEELVDRKVAGGLRMDQIVVMAYRDSADQIRALADKELRHANTADAKQLVILGVETLCAVQPSYITFCQEGPTSMRQALLTLDETLAQAYGGWAVHAYLDEFLDPNWTDP